MESSDVCPRARKRCVTVASGGRGAVDGQVSFVCGFDCVVGGESNLQLGFGASKFLEEGLNSKAVACAARIGNGFGFLQD